MYYVSVIRGFVAIDLHYLQFCIKYVILCVFPRFWQVNQKRCRRFYGSTENAGPRGVRCRLKPHGPVKKNKKRQLFCGINRVISDVTEKRPLCESYYCRRHSHYRRHAVYTRLVRPSVCPSVLRENQKAHRKPTIGVNVRQE